MRRLAEEHGKVKPPCSAHRPTRYLLRHAGVPGDFVGPALQLQHRVLVQELCEQEHTALGEAQRTACLFSCRHIRTGTAFPHQVSLATRSPPLRRTQLPFCTALPRAPGHHPTPWAASIPIKCRPQVPAAGEESPVSAAGLRAQVCQSAGFLAAGPQLTSV